MRKPQGYSYTTFEPALNLKDILTPHLSLPLEKLDLDHYFPLPLIIKIDLYKQMDCFSFFLSDRRTDKVGI